MYLIGIHIDKNKEKYLLFLPRQINESLLIGNDIEIKIISINEHQVCLGIKAPKSFGIHRKEVIENKKSFGNQKEYRNEKIF